MSKRKKHDRQGSSRKYNLRMIADFIDDLKWELQASVLENRHPGCRPHPELVEQLGKYKRRYGPHQLLAYNAIEKASPYVPDGRLAEATRDLHERVARERQEQLDHLESLAPLFKEALSVARHDMKKGTAARVTVVGGVEHMPPVDTADSSAFVEALKARAMPLSVLEEPAAREELKKSDLVFGYFRDTDSLEVFYGKRALEQAAASGRPFAGPTAVFSVSNETSEIEYLCAALQVLKGSYDYHK